VTPSGTFLDSTKGVNTNNSSIASEGLCARVGYWSLLSSHGEQAPVPHGGRPHHSVAANVEIDRPSTSNERNA
jgi:hypothetical protein